MTLSWAIYYLLCTVSVLAIVSGLCLVAWMYGDMLREIEREDANGN